MELAAVSLHLHDVAADPAYGAQSLVVAPVAVWVTSWLKHSAPPDGLSARKQGLESVEEWVLLVIEPEPHHTQ